MNRIVQKLCKKEKLYKLFGVLLMIFVIVVVYPTIFTVMLFLFNLKCIFPHRKISQRI